MTLTAYVYPKLQTAKDLVRQTLKKPRSGTPFHRQHVKGSQKLLQPARQHLYEL